MTNSKIKLSSVVGKSHGDNAINNMWQDYIATYLIW